MLTANSIDCKTTLGFSGIAENSEKSHVQGFIRLKPSEDARILPNHVILILDLSLSMAGNISSLKESIKLIIDRLETLRDKCTIIGFAGETKLFCEFMSIQSLHKEFDSIVIKQLSTLEGTTDFKAGVNKTISTMDRLAMSYPPNCASKGNEVMELNAHNNIAIFMTDGKNYGNVPWAAVDELANQQVTLHTVGLSKNIDKEVRQTLLKMARIGGGGFNFSKTIADFHKKVDTLLDLSLNAVTKPAKLQISPRPEVTIINSTIIGHPEQASTETVPKFVFPALKAGERKILLFNAEITKPYLRNERVPLLTLSMIPDYLVDSKTDISVSVMPMKNFLNNLSKGINADLRVHMLMKEVDDDIEHHLDSAGKADNIDMFKNNVKVSLNKAIERIETSFQKHPRRVTLLEHITQLSNLIDEANTIVDPKEFFSTIYAVMRTTR